MSEIRHWADDSYWTEALDRLSDLQSRGNSQLSLDLNAISKVAFDAEGPAYKLMEAMVSVYETEGWDGHRGAPRVMLALLVRLSEISKGRNREEGSEE